MPEPYKTVFRMPNGSEVTSVVLDHLEFIEFVDSLAGITVIGEENQRAAQAQLDSIKAARILPMISRGDKTQFVFEKYEIETDLACFIVRGTGQQLVRNAMTNYEQTNRQRNEGYDSSRN